LNIHPTAIVAPGAKLGVDVEVGPFSIIEDGAVLGDRCRIGPHVMICGNTTLGDDCEVHMGAALGDAPQDISYKNEKSYVRIGNRARIREHVTVHRGTAVDSATVIGDDCFLMALSHVAHNCHLGNRVILGNNVLLAGHVTVEDRVIISGGCAVHQFVRVGTLAFFGGGVRVNKDVPPYMTVNNDNTISMFNVVGLRRAGFNDAARAGVKAAFQKLYRSGLNLSQALAAIESTEVCPEVRYLLDFIHASKRGVCSSHSTHAQGGAIEE